VGIARRGEELGVCGVLAGAIDPEADPFEIASLS
jgi:hypothetical protein